MTDFTTMPFGEKTDARMGYQVIITANAGNQAKRAANSKGQRIPRMFSRIFHKTSGTSTQKAAAKSDITEKGDHTVGRNAASAHSKADASTNDQRGRLKFLRKDSGYAEAEEEEQPVCKSAYVPQHAGVDAMYLSIPQGNSRSESVASGDYLRSLAEDARRRAARRYVEEEEEESMAVSEDLISAAAWEADEDDGMPVGRTTDTTQSGYFHNENSRMSPEYDWKSNWILVENNEEQADVLHRMSLAHTTPIRTDRRSNHQQFRSSASAASTATTNRHLSSLSTSTVTTAATVYSDSDSEAFTGSSRASSFGPCYFSSSSSMEENASLSRRAGGLRPGEKIGRKVASYVRPPMPRRHEAPQQAGVSKTAICLYDADY